MKERIVIEKEVLEKLIKALPVQWFKNEGEKKIVLFGKEYQIEKQPETFEDLKELIKQKVKEDNHNGIKKGFGSIEYILIDDKSFLPTGEILDEDNDVFAVNRTPDRMYQIIKSLIGEER